MSSKSSGSAVVSLTHLKRSPREPTGKAPLPDAFKCWLQVKCSRQSSVIRLGRRCLSKDVMTSGVCPTHLKTSLTRKRRRPKSWLGNTSSSLPLLQPPNKLTYEIFITKLELEFSLRRRRATTCRSSIPYSTQKCSNNNP